MSEETLVIYRSLVTFVALLVFTRILGKQQVSQLTFFDYVIGITVGSIAADIVDTNRNLYLQLLGLVAWMFFALVLQIATLKSRKISSIVDGDPVLIIKNGNILEKNMAKNRYKLKELREQLRLKGAFNLSDVEYAILETNGDLSVLKKSELLPVTPADLNLPIKLGGYAKTLILEGKIITKNLDEMGLTPDWLRKQLSNRGIKDVKEVVVACLDPTGKIFIDKYQDKK